MTNSRDPSRPNAAGRRAHRRWMLNPDAGFGGDGATVPCSEPDCQAILTFETIFIDRIVPGEHGGRYVRANIKPHCGPCSHRQGQRRTVALVKERRNGCSPAANAAAKGREDSTPKRGGQIRDAPIASSARNGSRRTSARSSPIAVSIASNPARIRKGRASSRPKTTALDSPDLGA